MNNNFREAIISALESCKAREHKMSLLSDFEHEKVFVCEDCAAIAAIKNNFQVYGKATKFLCSVKTEGLSYYVETDEKFVERYIN